MIWHIVKFEIYENLNSVRFALTTVLLVVLMLTNAVLHLREHPERMQKYHTSVTEALNTLKSRTDLYEIALKGPGVLYKKPSALCFCADGGESFLSGVVETGDYSWGIRNVRNFWQLTYPSTTPDQKNINPSVPQVDWAFVIGNVLSLVAILFTFDSISGERERGTLRLMLANPIPRHTVLIGKFLGALVSVQIPFALGMLMNLLVIFTSSDVYLGVEELGRLGIIFLIALLYTCLFLVLGLLASSCVRQSVVSLMILLVSWVTLVVFIPNTVALVAEGFSSPMTSDEFWKRKYNLRDELRDQYRKQISTDEPSYKSILAGSELVTKEVELQERLNQEHLKQQIAQFQIARSAARVSPRTIVQDLIESFAGTGFDRHQQFLESVRRYAHQFREFIVSTDRADLESLHLIGVREGMSQNPVNPEVIPKFEDTLNLNRDFRDATPELFLLVLFFVVLLAAAYLAFLLAEV